MHKRVKQKVLNYVQSGYLLKLKHYLETYTKKNVDLNLNFKSGDLNRTPLHVACLFGDDAVVRCLLRFGASAEMLDKNKETPLHLAAKFVGEEGNYSGYKNLIDPLIRDYPDVLSWENKWRETSSQLLKDAKERYTARKEDEENAWKEEVGSCYKDQEEEEEDSEEKKWKEKLRNEWDDDCADVGVRDNFILNENWDDFVPDYPTFEQWADQMAEEYRRKNQSKVVSNQRRKEENKKRKRAEVKDMTDRMEREHENYRKRRQAMKDEILESKHKNYKEKMTKHKDSVADDDKKKLRFKDIPWPCLGSMDEMMEVIMTGQPAGDNKVKRKYILKQLILWHPDKFAQRCSNLLADNDKESILDTVKTLSQALNNVLKTF
uniref:NF-kappa-B inhibitor-like protein 1 n=1 Tax=Ciona intestinalis TaxID=7719 RepID=UPI000180CC7C|nr:NF-kappa-B inhibitor-like protein 1 [Ciona intestinalis]|eukprot:XP_002125694.1 NF-kappa-B inhibitor-like protein 1 [Ciona intestinalis]